MEKLISEILSDGIIRPSNNSFSSLVLLVKKKDEIWHFCVDYRAINAVTVKDRFPIPIVDELLDELHGATIFSKLDLKYRISSLYAHRNHEDNIVKMHLNTTWHYYEFLVMPFGLSNAPFTFQATMNHIFRSVLHKFVLVFFDDILVYTHYALLAAPLTQLLRKDAFVWSDSATTTFNKLKLALTQTPVLTLLDFSKAFIIQTDASGYWIGAILSQGVHLIAYFSKQMSLRLQQASTYAREMFAITEAVKRSENVLADALSCISHGSLNTLQAVSTPVCNVLATLKKFLAHHTESIALIKAISDHLVDYLHYQFREGLILYKNQILVLSDSTLQQLLLAEYHNNLIGGHARMQRTLACISSTFYWPNMKEMVHSFVSQSQDFPSFKLEDKVLFNVEGNDASQSNKEPNPNNQLKRRSTRITRVPAKLKEHE
ncbi:reverse transcriptase [Tanacetum coccineum]